MVEKQALFARTVSSFIQKAFMKGYLLTFGEAWRPDFVAEHYARTGKGIKNSLHISRLAIDLNAYYEGKWLDGKQAWTIPHLENLGKLWLSLDANTAWGGTFKNRDYNHYSFAHNGVK